MAASNRSRSYPTSYNCLLLKIELFRADYVGRDAQRGVMVKPAPTPSLIVTQPEVLLQVLVVRSMRQRILVTNTICSRVAYSGAVVRKYFAGSASPSGHSISNHSSGHISVPK